MKINTSEMNYQNPYNFQALFQSKIDKDKSTTKYGDTSKVRQEWELQRTPSAI